MAPIVGTIIASVVFAGGAWIALRSARLLKLTARISDWRTTTGRVVASSIKVKLLYRSWVYVPDIVYEYTVEGKVHRSNRFAIGTETFWRQEMAERLVSQYPTDTEIAVHYHPVIHHEAFLQEGGRWHVGSELMVGIALAIAGFVGLVVSLA